MHQDLIDLLSSDIPIAPKEVDGFLDITWQGHKENVISRIYGYFLDTGKNKAIANLFIDTLLELIEVKSGKRLSFENYDCLLEANTDKGNRIDILIQSSDTKEAIIIENKIYHSLNNDLADYWNHIKFSEENKVGILLTLNKCNIPNEVKGKFINVTHSQWIDKIKQKGIPSGLTTNEYVYLNDFINNIERLSKSQTMNELAKFFFENTEKVLKAIDTHEEAEKYIKNQLEITAQRVAEKYDNQNWHLTGTGWGYRQIWDGTSHVYYTIIYDELLKKEKQINIIIEIYKEAIIKEQELRSILTDNKSYKNLYIEGRKTPHWIHFAANKYAVTNLEIERLGDFVFETIERDFEPVMDIILQHLD